MAQQIDENYQEELATSSRRFQFHTYSINELESFRFLNLEDQERRWSEVYQSLESEAAKEYDELRAPNPQNKKQTKAKTKKKKKDAASKIMDAMCMELENGVHMEEKETKVDAIGRNGRLESKDVDGKMNEGGGGGGSGKGRSYSRSEMEALRFADAGQQKRWWKEVCDKFSSDSVEKFDGLWVANDQNQQQQSRNAGWKNSTGKRMDPYKHSDAMCMELENGVHMEEKETKVDAIGRNGRLESKDVDGKMNEGGGGGGSGKGRSYSRSEMEALRFADAGQQKRWWKEVCDKFSSDSVEKFDGLWVANDQNQQQQSRNAGWKNSTGKRMDPYKHSDAMCMELENGVHMEEKETKVDAIGRNGRLESKDVDGKMNEGGGGGGSGKGRSYSRSEMEALRFADAGQQKRWWKEVCDKFSSDSVEKFDGLWVANDQNQQQQSRNAGWKNSTGKRMDPYKHSDAMCMELENGVHMEEKETKVDAIGRNGRLESKDVDGKMNEGGGGGGSGKGRSYSRSEMEALRFADAGQQKRWWKEVCDKFSSDSVEKFDGLWVANDQNQQQQSRNAGWKNSTGKRMDPYKHSGNVSAVKSTYGPHVQNDCGDTLDHNGNGIGTEEPLHEYDNINDEDDSSSDEYSIQRPAFFVEGEPDFESGPPLDGLEYLRRVRWEAAQIPKVKAVRLDSNKLTSEQTAYMPSIPEIPKCPQNLLPSKDWENVFLADFSELRREIAVLESSCEEPSLDELCKAPQKQSDCIQHLKKNPPTSTAILRMDAVSRAAALRKSISSFEAASNLSKDDCLWLFALCAAVDAPLHADTCASLRCLLRKCSGLLALKSEPDEEVAMLSILITIAGKYFGQLDNL